MPAATNVAATSTATIRVQLWSFFVRPEDIAMGHQRAPPNHRTGKSQPDRASGYTGSGFRKEIDGLAAGL